MGQNPKVRLREKPYPPGIERYMTLSHCWGKLKSTKVRLTVDNLASFCEDIDFHSLPLTFQEALEVTLEFNTNFLWIDALCILQDSNEDWLNESATMANVYSNSYLNISATAGTDSDSGLFRSKRSQVPEDAVDFEATWTGDLLRGQCILYGKELFKSDVDKAPLNERAWVVQERALAPRVLHFAEHHLFWECDCFAAMDNLPSGLNAGIRIKEYQSNMEDWDKHMSVILSPYCYWAELVMQYCLCQLTKSSDKLIAISALAQSVMNLLQARGYEDLYLAGLWKCDLGNGLLWSTIGASNGGGTRIRTKSVTPSWTWASVHDAQIWYPIPTEEEILLSSVSIIDVFTLPIRTEFGPVNGGVLRIQGSLCEIKLATRDNPFDLRINGSSSLEMVDSFKITLNWDVRSDEREPYEDLVFMAVRQRSSKYYKRVEGLLLARTEKQAGQYTRAGRLDLDFDTNHEFSLDDAKIWSSVGLPRQYYEEYDGNGRYRISIN